MKEKIEEAKDAAEGAKRWYDRQTPIEQVLIVFFVGVCIGGIFTGWYAC